VTGAEKRYTLRSPKNVDAYITAHFKHNTDLFSEPMKNQIIDFHPITSKWVLSAHIL
jgi:hypothetical protein